MKMYLKNFVIILCLLAMSARKAFANKTELENEEHNLCAESAYSNICVKLGEKYYLIDGNAKLNWFDAERLCRRQNGYLPAIENAHEMSLISDYLVLNNYLTGNHWFWIGNSDLGSEGIFYSIETGNLMPFTKWSPNQPDNAGGHENCVHLWAHAGAFYMNDVGCDRKINYICELKEKKTVTVHPIFHRSV